MRMSDGYKKWIKDAEWIEVDLELNTDFAASHIKKIMRMCNFKYNKNLAEEALRCIMGNLIINSYYDQPTIIPANKRDCKMLKDVANIEWFVLGRLNTILQALEELGYVGHAKGFKTQSTAALSKYWLLDNTAITKLIDEYKESPVVYKSINGGGFIIKDSNKIRINWTTLKTNKKIIAKMNAAVNKNNKYMNKQVLTLNVNSKDIMESGKSITRILMDMTKDIITKRITLNIDTNKIKLIENRIIDKIQYILITTEQYYYMISNKIIITKLGKVWKAGTKEFKEQYSYSMQNDDVEIRRYNIVKKVESYRSAKGLTEPHKGVLCQFGSAKQLIAFNGSAYTPISRFAFFMSGTINDKTQIRIFNDSSFGKGGRLYWGPWNKMPKVIRRGFLLDGEPVVRIDFVGLHLRMCYHSLGKQFLGEPYIYAKGVNDKERSYMKLAGLIVFNTNSMREAIYALLRKLIRKGSECSYDDAKGIIEEFKLYHDDISGMFFHESIGKELQYKDSNIMVAILTRLREMDIPAISVHDEIIVPEHHREVAKEVMLSEYKKETGFETTAS